MERLGILMFVTCCASGMPYLLLQAAGRRWPSVLPSVRADAGYARCGLAAFGLSLTLVVFG
jgi:hypothetical protein